MRTDGSKGRHIKMVTNEDRWIWGFRRKIGWVKSTIDANCYIQIRLNLQMVRFWG